MPRWAPTPELEVPCGCDCCCWLCCDFEMNLAWAANSDHISAEFDSDQ